MQETKLKIGISQIAPVWLNKQQTVLKIIAQIDEAGSQECQLVVFGEGLLPGYPFWVELTDGARFNSDVQKEIYVHYFQQAVQIGEGDLGSICSAALRNTTAIYLGCIERAADRGNHSLYCSMVYIDAGGAIQSIHRKLVPTYEERLVWSNGDGKGLTVHSLGAFTVGGLNCWENWLPLARTTLYAQGENLHVSIWPGSVRNTEDITRFIAKESRSYVIAASGLMRKEDINDAIPHFEKIRANAPVFLGNGGSCMAAPDGTWVIEPVIDKEALLVATIDVREVIKERQNFDPSGHYSRPDVFTLKVDTKRQTLVELSENANDGKV
ncbi:MAG TPA: carbon-nitrogen hydrolase family protein [Flavisolibacter sp.]|jgi:nitrilase|nr:carbon-nitrogen hydrolase family protein [Flavisolibacter sp.]